MERTTNSSVNNSRTVYNLDRSPTERNMKTHGSPEKSATDVLPNCEENVMNCFLCPKIFTDIDEMQDHLFIHYAENLNPATTPDYSNCSVCGRSLRSESELTEHHKRYHEATLNRKETEATNNLLQCQICDKVYRDWLCLRQHVELVHGSNMDEAEANELTNKTPAKLYVALQYTEPKRKYPPRSPYFNPNLFVDPNGYV